MRVEGHESTRTRGPFDLGWIKLDEFRRHGSKPREWRRTSRVIFATCQIRPPLREIMGKSKTKEGRKPMEKRESTSKWAPGYQIC